MILPVINLVGATATGKSDLAISLAQHLGGEIINADSMQFYRGMDIGTAKVPPAERGGVPHHLLDILDVTQDASVSEYQRQARTLIADIRARGRYPIIVGGSGLYVRAATDTLEFPGTDRHLRARLEAIVAAETPKHLHELLTELDPAAGKKIEPTDARRVIRAVEVIALTGDTFTSELPTYEYITPTVQIGLAQDRTVLHERIAARVDAMFAAGWVDEVRTLLGQGLAEGRTAQLAIGYPQIMKLLAGEMTLEQARENTIIRTRQFAKRQETWFRRDTRIVWFEAHDPHLLDRCTELIEGQK